MSLEIYLLINFLMLMLLGAGMVLPALVIYFYSSYKNQIAFLICAAFLMLLMLAAGSYMPVLLPVALPILLSSFVGSLLRKKGENFLNSLGYMIMAELSGIIVGIIVIYFYFNMQDIAGLLAQGFQNAYSGMSETDTIGVEQLNMMTQTILLATQGTVPDISAMSISEQLDIIVPYIKLGVASLLPSAIMGYGIISGVWNWFLSAVIINKRAKSGKKLKGIKDYMPHPPLSEWRLPRWITNILMVLLLAAILFSLFAQGSILNVASALQTVALVILGMQGVAVVNWWLKKKNVPTAINVLICCVVIAIFSFILPWIGLFDVVFAVRMTEEQKNQIKKKMEEIKRQVDEQMRELEDEQKHKEESKNEEADKSTDENNKDDANDQEESEDK